MKKCLSTLILLLSFSAYSHPVIYKDGWVYWANLAPDMNSLRISYTPNPKYSLEVNSTWLQNLNEYRDYTFGFNYLFKRWLAKESQGNIYGAIHGGYYKDDRNDGFAGHAMLMGDWESRKHYSAASAMAFYYNDDVKMKYSARYGIAPYIAGMNTLQTWLIAQVEYFRANDKNPTFTPMIRFFYKNVLWETGANLKGDFFLTLMVHF